MASWSASGTGDTLSNTPFTKQTLQGILERLGVSIRGQQIRTGNRQYAAVRYAGHPHRRHRLGTGRLQEPAWRHPPGEAAACADGNVYAVAQGSLAFGGFQAEGEAAKLTRGVPTVGRLTNGAIIERRFSLASLGRLRLALRYADFTTAKRIAIAINDYLGTPVAEPLDPSTVQLTLPPKFPQNLVAMLTEIEQL
jgi:flagellar P-ring protein FlgI